MQLATGVAQPALHQASLEVGRKLAGEPDWRGTVWPLAPASIDGSGASWAVDSKWLTVGELELPGQVRGTVPVRLCTGHLPGPRPEGRRHTRHWNKLRRAGLRPPA